jgi:hypothetical protein
MTFPNHHHKSNRRREIKILIAILYQEKAGLLNLRTASKPLQRKVHWTPKQKHEKEHAFPHRNEISIGDTHQTLENMSQGAGSDL